MSSETEVTVYYGPVSWFKEELALETKNLQSLLEIVYERDEALRQLKIVQPDYHDGVSNDGKTQQERPQHVMAESSDYASLNEHVISNFAGLVRSINPERLHLQNPPAHVQAQLERSFSTNIKRYNYPAVTRQTLVSFRDGFADHLVGQWRVMEQLLSALYPLTTERQASPIVLMLYGPSGVGKTESAQFANSLLGGTLMRKQFSMFHNEKFASYLFGGKHSEPSFAYDLLNRESGVILIDEFDKANPVFHSAFYQLFDGGVFEDKNYTVRVGASLIICTSNYGSEQEIREALGEALYSRFDALIRFEPLSREEIKQVIDRLVESRFARLQPYEQAHLGRDQLKLLLYPLADHSGNVRKLGKMVDEVISLLLVRALLGSTG